MHTTVAVQPATQVRLMELKRKNRLRNVDAVIQMLLDGPPATAKQLFAAHETDVRNVCRKYGVRRLVAFGSRARGDARPDSDLDLCGKLPPGTSLLDVAVLRSELERAFGVPVGWVSEGDHLGDLRKAIARDGVVLIG